MLARKNVCLFVLDICYVNILLFDGRPISRCQKQKGRKKGMSLTPFLAKAFVSLLPFLLFFLAILINNVENTLMIYTCADFLKSKTLNWSFEKKKGRHKNGCQLFSVPSGTLGFWNWSQNVYQGFVDLKIISYILNKVYFTWKWEKSKIVK